MENEPTEAKDFDQLADEKLDELETVTPAESSAEIKPEDEEAPKSEDSGAEPAKTEQVKEVEADESLSIEDKIAKVKEILGDDQGAIDAYVKEKGYHNDPAWIKQRERIAQLEQQAEANVGLSEEDKTALEEFKALRSSPEYIQMTMKQQGFTQDKIDEKLKEAGIDIAVKPEDDVQLVVEKLGVDLESMAPDVKANVIANIKEFSQVAEVIFNDRMSKALGKELGPIKDHMATNEQKTNANDIIKTMKDTVKVEGILDFDKDIEPVISKFMDENPDAIQADVLEHFKSINHTMTLERVKTGKRQEERDGKRNEQRQNVPISKSGEELPAKTGNFDTDADAFLDAGNIH